MVQNTGSINHLPAEIFVVCVPHKERLCSKCIGLHLNVRARHLVDKAGLAHIGKSAQNDGTCVGVNGGQASKMLTDLAKKKRGVCVCVDGCVCVWMGVCVGGWVWVSTALLGTHLFQVCKGADLALHDGAQTTKTSTLELFAAIQRVAILQQAHIIL